MLALPRAIVGDRLTLEIADVDVVEQRLLEQRNTPAAQDLVRRLARAREARVDTQLERELRELPAEAARFLAALFGERHGHARIAVHTTFDVERRMRVTGEHEQAQRRRDYGTPA